MFKINVITVNETVFFAAEELKKYLRMVLVCGQNFCCGQYVVVMWSAMPSEFCRQCKSGGVCIVALVKAIVKWFRR